MDLERCDLHRARRGRLADRPAPSRRRPGARRTRRRARRMKPARLIPLVVFAALAAVLAVYLWQVGPGGKRIDALPSALIDKPAPEFALKPLEGATVPGFSTADLKGHVTLINFFASW